MRDGFLASDDARLITGVNLPVDAGLTASNGQPPQYASYFLRKTSVVPDLDTSR